MDSWQKCLLKCKVLIGDGELRRILEVPASAPSVPPGISFITSLGLMQSLQLLPFLFHAFVPPAALISFSEPNDGLSVSVSTSRGGHCHFLEAVFCFMFYFFVLNKGGCRKANVAGDAKKFLQRQRWQETGPLQCMLCCGRIPSLFANCICGNVAKDTIGHAMVAYNIYDVIKAAVSGCPSLCCAQRDGWQAVDADGGKIIRGGWGRVCPIRSSFGNSLNQAWRHSHSILLFPKLPFSKARIIKPNTHKAGINH